MGHLAKGLLMLSLSLIGMAAAATELQGFKDIKFGVFPSDLCGVKYLKRSICKARRDDTPIDAFIARGNQNLGGLTAFGYTVEDILIYGTWSDGVRWIMLESTGNEGALVTAVSKSFGDHEYWEEPKSDVSSRHSADLTRVYFWKAQNGTSISLRLNEYSSVTPRTLTYIKFEDGGSTEATLRNRGAPDANDF